MVKLVVIMVFVVNCNCWKKGINIILLLVFVVLVNMVFIMLSNMKGLNFGMIVGNEGWFLIRMI